MSSGLSPLHRRCALPAATPPTVVPGHKPSLTPLYASLDSSVTLACVFDCRDARDPLGLKPDPSKPSRHPLVGASAETRVSPHGFSGSSKHLCLDSVPPSLPPLVHGFPCSNDAIGTPRLERPDTASFGSDVCSPSQAAGSPRKVRSALPSLVLRVLPSTLLPGFIGPDSSVLPVDLPPSAPLPLRVLLLGSVF